MQYKLEKQENGYGFGTYFQPTQVSKYSYTFIWYINRLDLKLECL